MNTWCREGAWVERVELKKDDVEMAAEESDEERKGKEERRGSTSAQGKRDTRV